ncbi:MAG: Gfo/Idh/MocA family protein [Hyphomicrobiales bacterium]
MSQRVIHVGIGAFGKRWCGEFLKRNVEDGTIEVVALVDVDPQGLAHGREALGLASSQCFTDARRAFAEIRSDFCTIAVPPRHHEAVIDLAIAHELDILCEKPIAETMEASVRIARKVRAAGRKMAVTMSHRFDQDKTTLRRIVRSGVLGKVGTVSCRFQADRRRHMAWSSLFRHEMPHPLLIEGAIHHLDIIADLAGAPCRTLFADSWKPDWAEYLGDTDGIVTMAFENGVRGVYEGSASTAVGLNDFYKEYLRVDGERGTAILNHREIEIFTRLDALKQEHREGFGQKIPLAAQPKWINTWLVEQFARWREGGPEMETHIAANLQASALVFGAIESARTGNPVKIQDYIASFG